MANRQVTAVISAALVLWASHGKASEEKRWICVADAATGFAYESGQWKVARFDFDDSRYIVAKRTRYSDEVMRYAVTKIGEEYGDFCEGDGPNEYGIMRCGDDLDFRVNVKTLRYLLIYPLGYYTENDETSGTPYMEIGKCSPM